MAIRAPITCINKTNRHDPHNAIANFGGPAKGGGQWKQSLSGMLDWIDTDQYTFYVIVSGHEENVIVATSAAGNRYLKTVSDSEMPNNLLSLWECL